MQKTVNIFSLIFVLIISAMFLSCGFVFAANISISPNPIGNKTVNEGETLIFDVSVSNYNGGDTELTVSPLLPNSNSHILCL